MKLLGYFVVIVTYNSLTNDLKLFVIENGGPPLLGQDFMATFQLCITSILNWIDFFFKMRNLVDKYKELFGKDLGCYNHVEVTLQLKDGAKPKILQSSSTTVCN